MAETFTPRYGLIQWGAPTDGPSRLEFNAAFAQIEALGAIDKQGTLAARPAAGVQGTYYWATDVGVLYRDTGSSWIGVGTGGADAVFGASSIANKPLTLNAPSGQTADLIEANVNASPVFRVLPSGGVISLGPYTGTNAAFVNGTAGTAVISGKGAASQSADLLELKDSTDALMFRVQPSGTVLGSNFRIGSNNQSVIGAASVSNLTDGLFTGTPVMEFRSTAGGAGSTFENFMLLRHQQADATAVARRLGFHLKVGNESGDTDKTGSFYIESSAASFGNPSLVLARGDSAVMTFPSSGSAVIGQSLGLTVPGQLAASATGAQAVALSNTGFGVQGSGNHQYSRAASGSGWYWYVGGTHNSTAGNAGGGSQAMALSSTGTLTVPRVAITSPTDVSLGQGSPGFLIGAANSVNTILDDNAIQARNNGSAEQLYLNPNGGNVTIGNGSSVTTFDGGVKIQSKRIFVQTATPSSPSTGDVWLVI